MIRIERPIKDKAEDQMVEIVEYMVKNNRLLFYPVIFIRGWIEGKVKIYTKRGRMGEIIGMQIMSLFTCPVTGVVHKIENFKAGEDISDFVEESLKIYTQDDQL